MNFVHVSRVLLSSILSAALLDCAECSAAGPPREIVDRSLPAQSPDTSAPVPPAVAPPRAPEQVAAENEASRLVEELNAALVAEDFDRLAQLLAPTEAALRRLGGMQNEADYLIGMGTGLVALHQQRFDDAEQAFRAARAASSRLHGPDSHEVAELNMHLASITIPRYGLEAAKPLLDMAYPIYRKLDDPNDDLARDNLLHLISYEMERKRSDVAAGYAAELCDRWRRSEKPDDPDHLLALRALAHFRFELRDLAGARSCLDEAAELSARLNGPDHPDTQEMRAQALKTAELFRRSEQYGKLLFEAKELSEGLDKHSKEPEVLRSNVAKLLRLIEISKYIDDPGDKSDRWVLVLAHNYDHLNEAAEAMRYYRAFIAAADRESAQLEVETTVALLRLARLEVNHERNIPQARARVLCVAEHFAADPAEAKREWLARKYLVNIECTRGDLPAALGHLERYAQLMREIRRDRLPEEIAFRAQFAYVCGADPQLRDRCRTMLDEACRTSAETFGPRSAELGAALQWLAMFQYRAGEPTCADTLMNADRLLIPSEGENDVGASYRRLRIAKYLRAYGRLDDARGLYEAELKRLSSQAPSDANRAAIALGYLAGIDAHQGRREQAGRLYHEAVDAVAHQNDPVAKELTEFFGKQSVDLAAAKLPSLAPADNVDSGPTRFAIP